MKRIVVSIILIVIAHPCMADGWSELSGKNRNGDTVNVYPAWDSNDPPSRDYSIEENREFFYVDVHKGGKVSEKTSKTYKDQKCQFKLDIAGEPIQFSCEKSGKSPLSGAKYKIVPNKNPDDCSYQAKYSCVRGCDDAAIPRTMTKSHWEC